MPKNKRWAIKQDLDHAIGNIKSAQAQIVKTGERMKGTHDDIYQACVGIFTLLEGSIEVVKRLRDEI